eukprot:m.22741 g.22741  ORF g.22741 m.22741 type:complete len:199 (+) comp8359_c0_seq1:87-683(+)
MSASRLRLVARPLARGFAPGQLSAAAARPFTNSALAPRGFPGLFREFDEFFRPGFPFRGMQARETQLAQFGHVDVLETKEGHAIKMDIPGMKKEDIKIQIDEDNVLTLSGERTRTDEKKDTNYHHTERSFGKFVRSFRLPETCKPDTITAEVRDGVLTVNIPHAPTPARRVVDVPILEGSQSATAEASATAKGESSTQ